MFGIAIGGASILNLLLPYAFRSRNDVLIAVIQIMQGLVQVCFLFFTYINMILNKAI